MIFNSLGSNYNFRFAIKALFSTNNRKYRNEFELLLNRKYRGKTVLLYKGREAIRLALETAKLLPGSKVGITGFTCYAVYKAVVDAGCIPEYIDISQDLNFSLSAFEKQDDLRALIVQNTLGNPCDILGMRNFCVKKNILLIEDLAHSVGTKYADGSEAGSVGDFVALSFSQDKMIDAISGGALIVRNKKYLINFGTNKLKEVKLSTQVKDRFYPIFTFKVRKLYPIGLGKFFHFVLRAANLLSQPVAIPDANNLHNLPNWYSLLAKERFLQLEKNISHRREIALVYAKDINSKLLNLSIVKNIRFSSNLRFPIFVDRRESLFKYLKQYGIYISDTWYDAPISPKRLLKSTNYSGNCPLSEKISDQIVNLPTHMNVTVKDAEFISEKVNTWVNTK